VSLLVVEVDDVEVVILFDEENAGVLPNRVSTLKERN